MSDRRTPTPWKPDWDGPTFDTESAVVPEADAAALMPDPEPAPDSNKDPQLMTTRELMVEAVISSRAYQQRFAEGDRLFKTIDAELEMLAHSFQTMLRKLNADEAADKLAAYWDEKRRERNARSDEADD
jgi:hypothetical protein